MTRAYDGIKRPRPVAVFEWTGPYGKGTSVTPQTDLDGLCYQLQMQDPHGCTITGTANDDGSAYVTIEGSAVSSTYRIPNGGFVYAGDNPSASDPELKVWSSSTEVRLDFDLILNHSVGGG